MIFGSLCSGIEAGQGSKAGGIGYEEEVSPSLTAAEFGSNRVPALHQDMAVRRLTPVECERLQGFPDDYTRIPGGKGKWRDLEDDEDPDELKDFGFPIRLNGNVWQIKDPDGPRYKALGNSWAVPNVRWIGERIQKVDDIMKGLK